MKEGGGLRCIDWKDVLVMMRWVDVDRGLCLNE